MKTSDHEITIYYDPETEIGRETLALAQDSHAKVHDIDINKIPFTATRWLEIFDRLQIPVKEIIAREAYEYHEKYKDGDFSDEDYLKIIRKDPKVLKGPIAIRGKKAILVEEPTDILKVSW